jgi:hypothetical protein
VRAIVHRMRQANRWSSLYQERLRLYLGAWALFAAIVLIGRYLFQFELEGIIAGTFNLSYDGVFLTHFVSVVGAVFAGALGGASGALSTMYRYIRHDQGFFDRKYGLRGLILPVIGALVGLVIYLLFGLVYQLLGINPALNWTAATFPALCAFAFGFSQESIYGTRD